MRRIFADLHTIKNLFGNRSQKARERAKPSNILFFTKTHQVITQAEAIKFQKELKTFTDLLEKIKAVNPELL